MATTLNTGPQSTALTGERIELADPTVNRLREHLRTLATISTTKIAADRGSCMTSEATTLLNAIGCVIHCPPADNGAERVFLHNQTGVPPDSLRILAADLRTKIVSAGGSITTQDLCGQYPNESWLLEHDVQSYLGVPIFGADQSISAVAAVFGGPNRTFGQEDEWWLRTAGQLVQDSLACETLAGKLSELQRVMDPGLADRSTGENEVAERKPTILVIDDDRAVNDLICQSLSMYGYEAEPAFNGVEAIQAFRPAKHDLVITDVAMPLMNGWELIAALRVRSPALPIILISGYGNAEWNQSYLTKQGVSAVLNKPLNLDQLITLIARLIPLASLSALAQQDG